MSIKKWITISYIAVMLLPMIALYSLYHVLKEYDSGNDFKDYMNANIKIRAIEKVVMQPELYESQSAIKPNLKQLDISFTNIVLYKADGTVLFNTNKESQITRVSTQALYRNLYALSTEYNFYSLKKPVFKNQKIIGFYQINLQRDSFTKGAENRVKLVACAMLLTLLLILIIALRLLECRLNRPMKHLIDEISQFAKGQDVEIVKHTKNDEVGKLIYHFRAMKKEIAEARETLEKQQKDKEYMISAISHDLKTPLTAIMAYAEALKGEPDSTEDYTNVIINKGTHMAKMLDELMMYGIMQNQLRLNLVEVEGQEFFEMLLSGYSELCKSNELRLETMCQVSGFFDADVKNMIRVMDNLMSNAIRYTPENGLIGIAAITEDSQLPAWICKDFINEIKSRLVKNTCIFLVQNEGIGVDEKGLKEMFEPMYKCDESRQDDKSGTGLGLSIAKHIIEAHGGRIKALSNGNTHTLVMCLIKTKEEANECLER